MNTIIIIEIIIVITFISLAIVPPIICRIKNEKIRNHLKENGSVITASYLTTVTKETKKQSGLSSYNIVCIGMDPLTGKKINFKSEDLSNNPRKYIEDNHIEIFNVYLNLKNIKQYYVDVEELKKHLR